MHLGDADPLGDLGLGEVTEEPKDDDLLLALGQRVQRRAEAGAELGHGQIRVLHAELVTQLGAVDAGTDKGLQRDGRVGAGTLQTLDDVVLAALEVVGEVRHRGRAAQLLGQGGGGLVDVQLQFLQPPGDADVPGPVPEVALDLPDDGGYGISGEVVAVLGIEPVDRLYQAQRGDLGQVIQRLAAAVEALGQVLGQRMPGLDGLFAYPAPVRVVLGYAGEGTQQLHRVVADGSATGGRAAALGWHGTRERGGDSGRGHGVPPTPEPASNSAAQPDHGIATLTDIQVVARHYGHDTACRTQFRGTHVLSTTTTRPGSATAKHRRRLCPYSQSPPIGTRATPEA